MTFKAFYGMTFNPFDKSIQVEHIYESGDYKQFSSRMEYFKTAKGFALLYGEPGSGKTTSIRAFTAKLNPQLFKVVYLPLSSVTVMDFYRHLAVGLGLEPRFRKVDMFHQVQEYIANAHHQKNMTTFVIIDEAQFIQHAILNDLRLVFNFQMDSKNYAMVLLAGQSAFLHQLSLQINEPLRQRITINYGFKGLAKDEIGSYLTSLLKVAGVAEPLFTPDAVEAIAAFSNGLPRKVNNLAEKSLLVGYQRKVRAIDADIIQTVQEDADIAL
ncbi:ATPase AAA [Clostridiales bacterium PH28_bin88]|nr:ATPase AAA [Clostridiales bacterium PH28_bin88]